MIDYEQTILQSLFQGFQFKDEKENRRIEPSFQQYVPKELRQIGINECGFTENKAINYIQETLDGINGDVLNLDRFNNAISCRLSDIRPFSLIRIRHDGPTMTLLYLEDYKFCLLKAGGHTLRPGDRMQCWTYTLSVGSEAVFCVIRNGQCYPDERHVLRIGRIEALELFSPSYLSLPKGNVKVKHTVVDAVSSIYSWQPVVFNDGYAFLPQQFTTDSRAMYELDLKRMEFSLNKDFDQSLYQRTDSSYIDIVKTVCEYTEESDLEKRHQTITNGRLVPQAVNVNQYALLVQSKAIITL